MQEILEASEKNYSELKNLIAWVKDNGGMGTFYRSRHELIFAFKKGIVPHINSFELGQHGRYRTNVWNYRGMNSFGGNSAQELAWHPTVRPIAMIVDAIKDVSMRGGIVLDLFGGSGSTLIAAHNTGKHGYIAELDPLHCDLIIRRWQAKAARKARISDQDLCDAIAQVRLGQADDLGGGVFKKRLNKNEHRAIILSKADEMWIYEYVFAKKDQANIDDAELRAFRKLVKSYAGLTAKQIEALLHAKDWIEICKESTP